MNPDYEGLKERYDKPPMEQERSREEMLAPVANYRDTKGAAGERALQKALQGQTGQVDKAEAFNRRGSQDGDLPDFDKRAYYPTIQIGMKKASVFHNPWIDRKTSDFSATKSTSARHRSSLLRADGQSLRLVKEAMGYVYEGARKSYDNGYEAHQRTVLSFTTGEARAHDALIKAVAKFYGVPTREELRGDAINDRQNMGVGKNGKIRTREATAEELIKNNSTERKIKRRIPSDISADDAKKIVTLMDQELKMGNGMRSKKIKMADGSTAETKGSIGLIVSKGMEATALKALEANHSSGFEANVPKALDKVLANANPKCHISKPYKPNAQAKTYYKAIIDSSDVISAYWDGATDTPEYKSMQYAASQGKLGKVFDAKGRPVNDMEGLRKQLLSTYQSAEQARVSAAINTFDLSCDDGLGRVALSTIVSPDPNRSNVKQRLTTEDINALGQTGMSVRDIVGIATSDRPEELTEKYGLSANAVRIMRDETAIAKAAENFPDIKQQFKDPRIQIYTPEQMPEKFRDEFAFLIVNDPHDKLKDQKTFVADVGDDIPDTEDGRRAKAVIDKRTAGADEAIRNSDKITRMFLEDSDVNNGSYKSGDIAFLSSGHSVHKNGEHRANREQMAAAGVITISPFLPEGQLYYDGEEKDIKRNFTTENAFTTGIAAKMMGKVCDEAFVRNLDSEAKYSPARRVVEQLMERGGRPAITDTTDFDSLQFAGGNTAMLKHRVPEGLEKAGFGEAAVQKLKEEFEGALPAMNLGPNSGAGMANLIAKATGSDEYAPIVAEQKKQKEVGPQVF